jgi:3',5'-cyclic AMP phosphodiesterase CpdA
MPRPSLLATSDLHVSHPGNPAVVEQIRPYADGDWLIVAGDVADTVADVERSLRLLRSRFAKVIWAPGNHELWTSPRDQIRLRGQERYLHLVEICRGLDVLTPEDEYPIWRSERDDGRVEELAVAPLFLLYDYSWRPHGLDLAEALSYGRSTGIYCTDEFLLHPDPYPSRQDWARDRLRYSQARLELIPADRRTVLISHWPLNRSPTAILRWPHFAMWCGMEATQDWHLRYRAAVAVYGHLHLPMTLSVDGVRFEEVSLGYPREWRERKQQPPNPVRRIDPPDPARRPIDSRLLKAFGRARRKAAMAQGAPTPSTGRLRAGRAQLFRMLG